MWLYQTHQSNHPVPQKLTPPVVGVVPSTPSTHQAALTSRLILQHQQLQQQQQQQQLQQFQQQQQQQQQFQQIQIMDSSQATVVPLSNSGSQQIIGTALISSDSNNQLSTLKLQLQQPLVVQHGDAQQSSANTMWLEGMTQQQQQQHQQGCYLASYNYDATSTWNPSWNLN